MQAAELPIIEVARELQQPLADLARTLDQPPARIVNQALAEFLERRLRPDRQPERQHPVVHRDDRARRSITTYSEAARAGLAAPDREDRQHRRQRRSRRPARYSAARRPATSNCSSASRAYSPSCSTSSWWRAGRDHPAVIQHDDAVRLEHRRQPVRDDQRGAALAQALAARPAPAARSRHRASWSPRRAAAPPGRAGWRGRSRCAAAGRPTGARPSRRETCRSRRAGGRGTRSPRAASAAARTSASLASGRP